MKTMSKVKNAFVAALLAISLLAAAPVFAANVNNNMGSNNAVSQLQNNGQQQSNQMNGMAAKNEQQAKLASNNCPTGIQVPSPMGTW